MLAGSGCAASGAAQKPTATPTALTFPTPLRTLPVGIRPSPVAGLLDPAPTDCAAFPPPHTFTRSDFGGGFIGSVTFQGSSPAWELGLVSPLNLNQYSGPVPYPSAKVMWVVGPNYLELVTLQGYDVRTGAPLWFQIYPSNGVPTDNPDAISAYTTYAALDPRAPNRGSTDNSTGHWNIWGIGIIVLAAGCYELDVTWPQGRWSVVFAAGR
jgi:hypothetical protein